MGFSIGTLLVVALSLKWVLGTVSGWPYTLLVGTWFPLIQLIFGVFSVESPAILEKKIRQTINLSQTGYANAPSSQQHRYDEAYNTLGIPIGKLHGERINRTQLVDQQDRLSKDAAKERCQNSPNICIVFVDMR